jgi:hypothetical protein
VHTTITQDATAKLMNLFFYVFIPRIVCATLGGRLGGAGLSGPVLADAAVALSKLPELDTLEYVGLPRAVVYLLVHEILSTLPRPPKSFICPMRVCFGQPVGCPGCWRSRGQGYRSCHHDLQVAGAAAVSKGVRRKCLGGCFFPLT